MSEKKSYSDLLPRNVDPSSMICQYLNRNGRRCMNSASHEVAYHGDHETYGGWVCLYLCDKHYISYSNFSLGDFDD